MFWHRIFGESIEQELPSGWQVDLLDNVAIRGSGHTPDQEHSEYWNGGIKWVSLADSSKLDKIYIRETAKQISQLGIKNSSAVLHPTGTVVLSRDAGVGKSAILASDMAVSQHFISWRCGPKINNHFLYYVLQFMKPEFERQAVGSTIKTIGLGYFKKLQVVMPPLAEQRKIAAILGTWDAAIDKAERLVAALRARKRALMQRLLTGEVRFPGFETTPWKEQKIGDFLQESRIPGTNGQIAKKLTVKLYGKGVVPKEETIPGSADTRYYKRKKGQFIYSKLDFLNGAFGVVPEQLDGYESTLDLPAFDISALANGKYLLEYVIREDFYKRQLGLARGGRKARRVPPEEFLRFTTAFPDTEEQNQIAQFIQIVDAEIETSANMLEAYKQQKRGLMQRLLTGEVRVAGGEER